MEQKNEINQERQELFTKLQDRVFNVEKFKKARKNLMTVAELAEKSGISANTIHNIETNRKSILPKEYVLLCETLGIGYENFLEDEGFNKEYKRPQVITVLTNKGGAGKTTVAVNIAASLVHDYDKKVVIIDTDLQQNTTMHCGMLYPTEDTAQELERIEEVLKLSETHNFFEAFMNNDDITKHILHTKVPNLDIVVSADKMALIDQEIYSMTLRELRVRQITENLIENNEDGYDYIIIDCNPALSKFNETVLFATDYIIIPMEASAFGLRGVEYVLDFYMKIKKQHKKLQLLGIVLNKVNPNKNITKDVVKTLENNDLYSELVFDTRIPIDTNIELSQSYGEPVFISFKRTKAYQAYKRLTKEIINRIEAPIPMKSEE